MGRLAKDSEIKETLICPKTGIRILQLNRDVTAYRIAKHSRSPLEVYSQSVVPTGWVQHNSDGTEEVIPWNKNPDWSRWDTAGRTLYAAKTRKAAFAEVLQHQRQTQKLDHLERLASSVGMTLDEYLIDIDTEAAERGMMPRGQISRGWRDARAITILRCPVPDGGLKLKTVTP